MTPPDRTIQEPDSGDGAKLPDTGAPDAGASKTDGTLLLSSLADTIVNSPSLALDDTNLVYEKTTQDPVNGDTAQILVRPLAGGAETEVKSATGSQASELADAELFVGGGGIFRTTMTQDLVRLDIVAKTETTVLSNVRRILRVIGKYLVFIDGPENLRLYDLQQKSLDPTLYGTLQNPIPTITIQGSDLTWLTQDVFGDGKYHVSRATIGAAGGMLPRTFAQPPEAMLISGNAGLLLAGSPPSTYTFDPTTSTPAAVKGATLGFVKDFLTGGPKLYFFQDPGTGTGDDLIAMDVTGATTKIGHAENVGRSFATATAIYAVTSSGPGTNDLYRWTKP